MRGPRGFGTRSGRHLKVPQRWVRSRLRRNVNPRSRWRRCATPAQIVPVIHDRNSVVARRMLSVWQGRAVCSAPTSAPGAFREDPRLGFHQSGVVSARLSARTHNASLDALLYFGRHDQKERIAAASWPPIGIGLSVIVNAAWTGLLGYFVFKLV
jgi:hypothetical protein